MYKCKINFLTRNNSCPFEISSSEEDVVNSIVKEIHRVFIQDSNSIEVQALQKCSYDILRRLEFVVNKYKRDVPAFNGIMSFFRKLEIDEHFLYLPQIESEQKYYVRAHEYLNCLYNGTDFEESSAITHEMFSDLMDMYSIFGVGEERVSIGEPDKKKRICRFCNNQREKVTFSNKAHAISEGLGNKTVVLLEECDVCNEEFSEKIEPDIIKYLSFFRTSFNVKGKGGSKKIVSKDFAMKNEDVITISIFNQEEHSDEGTFPEVVTLKNGKINQQNVYKALCKFFLSVIDDHYLDAFSRTNDWINGKIEVDSLPYVAEMISYHSFSLQPKLIYYIRKSKNMNLPYAVCEFYFTCVVFVFIIPFSDKDDKDFLDKEDYKRFWEMFKHYKNGAWHFKDFSSSQEVDFKINLNFKKSGDEESIEKVDI